MKTTPSRMFSLRLPDDLIAMLRATAAVTGESVSRVSRRCLQTGIKFEKQAGR